MKYLSLLPVLLLFAACQGNKKSAPAVPEGPVKTFQVQTGDDSCDKLGDLLELDRYTVLAQEPLLGDIRRILINDDRIYLLDNTPQIVCYDLDGRVNFRIVSQGNGPQEFGYLLDFSIDPDSMQLVAYDNRRGSLVRYDMATGRYCSETPVESISAMGIAYANGRIYYDNADHHSYPGRKEMHYYLLESSDGNRIEHRYFPHDAVAEYDFNLGNGHPFFYNDGQVYYNNRFDKTVYILEPGGPRPVYEINLPNPVPLSEIGSKIDALDLIGSDYSSGMSDIFRCGDILYFWFTRRGRVHSGFYRTASREPVYCGYRMDNKPTRKLPFLSLMRGVYKNRFFAVVQPDVIIRQRDSAPDVFPGDLQQLSEMDNPVIAFYKPIE